NPPPPADTLHAWVKQFGEAVDLDLDRLAERLAQDEQGLPLAVELTTPGWVSRLAQTAIPGELIRYVRDYEYARLNTDYKRALKQNETDFSRQAREQLERQTADLARRHGLPATGRWLAQLQQRLEKTIHHLNSSLAEIESRQTALTQEVGHLELAFMQAAESGFLGRGQRIARSQHAYMTTVQQLFEVRWQMQIALSQLRLCNQLLAQVQQQAAQGHDITLRVQATRRTLAGRLTGDNALLQHHGASTRSLATPELINSLYENHAGPPADILAVLFTAEESPLDWQGLAPADIGERLIAACRPAFASIATTNVEQIIEQQRSQTPPEHFYAWLMGQATPSWNLDRTRMADGGATLQRLEVLGVPDEDSSIFRRYARMLVSTTDPNRITAFVAHVGAPHSAIQQWDSYQTVYQQAQGQTPLHILPQFQADSRRAEQSFALGSIFGFITNQGAYFYYNPADALERPIKLGQGLANSLHAFTTNSSLVQESRERVDQVVAGRGVEASLHTLARYYETSSGQPPGDELVLRLKRLVREYAAELRQIHQFAPGQLWTANGDHDSPILENEQPYDGR
ncbi:MAG: hypothetical protein KDJ65_37935, partial [Anaerolineae bacterium]|nr:hypothetical protein [Anaerolineae bacterium]